MYAIYSGDSNDIALTTYGSERMRIDNAGNVGIGTTTPNGTLSIFSSNVMGVGTSSSFNLSADSLTTGTGIYAASSTLTSGYLMNLQVSGTAAATSQTALNILTAGANDTNAITTYGAQISNTHTNATSGTNVALYLNASGATTANYGLYVNAGSIRTPLSDGTVTVASGILTTSSDERLKNIVGKFDRGLEALMGVKPIIYSWNELSDINSDKLYAGFSAQNIQGVIPEAVSIDSRGYFSLSDRPIIAATVNAIQQQQITILNINNQVNILGENIAELKESTSDSQGLLSEKIENLEGNVFNTGVELLSLKIISNYSKDSINNLGFNVNSIRDEMNFITNKLVATKFGLAPEIKSVYDFSKSSDEVSTNLENSSFNDESFGGRYYAAGEHNQISVELENGIDLSQYDMENGNLQFEIYIEKANLFEDFNAELGNIQDEKEIQWNKAAFPWLVDGWNTVKLSMSSGYEIGQVDWEKISHFRVFFKFKGENEIRIRNVKVQASKKTNTNSSALFALGGNTLELSSMENQNTLILALDGKASEMNTKINNQQALIDSIQAQVNEINSNSGVLNTAQIEANTGEISLIKSILGLGRVANAGDVDILGKLSAEKTESGQMLIKVSEEAKRTIGESAITSVKVDVNNDKIDDETRSDGKKVFVESLMANAKSRIFVTSKKATDQNLAVTSIVDKLGFWVEVKNQVSEDLTFDWWMVEENNVIVP